MRIGIDARFWGTNTGIGRYVEELFRAMVKEDAETGFVLFLRKENWDKAPEGARVKKVLAPARWYTLAEQIKLPAIFDGAGCDLLHFPHWNVPVLVRTPYVLTIHDLLLLDHPTRRASFLSPVKYAVKYLGYRFVLRRAISRARAIIAPSEFTASRIKNYFPDSAPKISVVYEGLTDLPEGPDFSALLQKGAQRPYLLYVGNAYPHKNLEMLIGAVSRLRESGEKINLALAGRKDDFYKNLENKFSGQAIFLGEMSDTELDSLYKNAEAYVFPSLEEGFGLPGLEAMARGIPVIASSAGALPEIYGNAALYFNPRDRDELARAIVRLKHEPELGERLKAEGIKRVSNFNWMKSAKKTLKIYCEKGK